MRDFDWGLAGMWALGISLAGLFGLWIAAIYYEGEAWQEFKAAHACHVTGQMQGSSSAVPIFDAKGGMSVGVSTTPDQTGWTCDDGVTYWRAR